MNILLYDMGSYIQADLITYLTEMGHHCKNVLYPLSDLLEDEYFEKYFTVHLQTGNYDCVISTNFQPLVAKICYKNGIKYLAWSYDSPILHSYPEYYDYPTSFTFLFDRAEVEEFHNEGLSRVFHLPLAVNTRKFSSMTITDSEKDVFSCDVSFVGTFYDSPLKGILSAQDDYTIGFLNALTDAQFKFNNFSFLSDIIDDALIDHINDMLVQNGVRYHTKRKADLDKASLLLCMNKQITRSERIILLHLINSFCQVRLFSNIQIEQLRDVPFMGPASYFSEMPKIFRCSKISLNPTLRSIRSGIPLRALDIIGSGGFLLSNFQSEFADYFRPDLDLVLYENIEDAIEKVKYYLSHDEERNKIQQNSYRIITEKFTYPDRIAQMFKTAGL